MSKRPEPIDHIEAARRWVFELDRRQCVGELLIQPPKSLRVLNGPTTTKAEADEIVKIVRGWLDRTSAAGGPADARRLWDRFIPYSPELRHTLRGDYDAALRVCTERELKARSIVAVADAAIGARQAQLQRVEAERAAIAKAREALAAREKALEASP
jgi:hypothetical protein